MGVTATWLGQSGFVLSAAGTVLLVDPWLSPHPERATPPPNIEALPTAIDVVLITHGHGDHLDLPGLQALSRRAGIAAIVAPAPFTEAIGHALPDIPVFAVRPGMALAEPLALWTLPAWHGIRIEDGYGSHIAADGSAPQIGYVVELGGLRLYLAGDTLAAEALVAPLRALAPDIAFLPVNGRDAAREARGILGNMDEAEAIAFTVAIGACTLVPLHHDGVTGNTSDIGVLARAAQGHPIHLLLPARERPVVLSGNTP